MKKQLLRAAASLLVGLGMAQAASAAIVVSLTPDKQSVALGETVNFDVTISGLGAEILSAVDMNITWNGSLLGAPQSLSFQQGCAALGIDAVCINDTNTVGNFGFQAFSMMSDAVLAAEQADSFVLAKFSLTGLSSGSTFVTLGADVFTEQNFTGLDFGSLSVDVVGSCVAVGGGTCGNAVPEPATPALVLLGLAGMAVPGALRRRRQP